MNWRPIIYTLIVVALVLVTLKVLGPEPKQVLRCHIVGWQWSIVCNQENP